MNKTVAAIRVHAPAKRVGRAKQRMSLRGRVTVLAAACVAVVMALVGVGAYVTVYTNLYQQVDDNLSTQAVAAVQTPQVRQGLQEIPGAFLNTADIQIGLLDASGTMQYPKEGRQPPATGTELAVARGTATSSLRTDAGSNTRVIAVEYSPGEALVLAQSLGPTKQILNELAVVLALIGGGGIIVAALAGTAVARTGLRPIERLTSATEHIARTGDLRPIPVSGDDELTRLTRSFNTMLGAVAESQERQRQLVADAGHELRTPLTSLRTNLELLLSASRGSAPELSDKDRVDIEANVEAQLEKLATGAGQDLRTSVMSLRTNFELLLSASRTRAPALSQKDRTDIETDIKAQLDELTQLIGDLVELARQDDPHIESERVEMIEVVERAVDRVRRRAGEITFDVQLQPWFLAGDPNTLERAVVNLLDNAAKFSPAGSTVRVRMYSLGDGTAVIEVADSGPGIAETDLPKVFDRFYRSSEARTLPGSGLGLSIVKQAAERHGGSVYAGQAPQGGALLTIRVPGSSV